jgi:Cytochrome bd terminal oxidase subunit I
MNALDLARWQFGITTIYHFLFMPLSIGLSLLIAILQTAWFRTVCRGAPLARVPAQVAWNRLQGRAISLVGDGQGP